MDKALFWGTLCFFFFIKIRMSLNECFVCCCFDCFVYAVVDWFDAEVALSLSVSGLLCSMLDEDKAAMAYVSDGMMPLPGDGTAEE